MVVNKYGFYIVQAQVVSVNTDNGRIQVRLFQNDPVVTDIVLYGSKGVKYLTPYSPNLKLGSVGDDKGHFYRLKDEHALNIVSGMWNLPRENDYLLLAVYLYQPPSAKYFRQNPLKEVIVLGQIAWHNPQLNKYDNMLLDQSGAKIHFNHGWLDTDNIIGKDFQPAGHVTLVGNRFVSLSGKKFLNWSLLSHQFQRGIKKGAKEHDPEIVIDHGVDSKNNKILWSKLFTRDKDYADLFVPSFTKGLQPLTDNNRFLEPPSIPNDARMDMHDSGYKRVIYGNGNMQEYVRGRFRVIGSNHLPLSFAPEGKESWGKEITGFPFAAPEIAVTKDIADQIGDQGDTQDLEYHTTATEAIGTEKNRRAFGLEEKVSQGVSIIIPTTPPTDIKAVQDLVDIVANNAEVGKYKIIVGSLVIEIDGSTDAEIITLTVGGVTFTIDGTDTAEIVSALVGNVLVTIDGNSGAENIDLDTGAMKITIDESAGTIVMTDGTITATLNSSGFHVA